MLWIFVFYVFGFFFVFKLQFLNELLIFLRGFLVFNKFLLNLASGLRIEKIWVQLCYVV